MLSLWGPRPHRKKLSKQSKETEVLSLPLIYFSYSDQFCLNRSVIIFYLLKFHFVYLGDNYIGAAVGHVVTHAHLVPAVVEAEAAVTAGGVATGLCLAFLATRVHF